MSSDYESSQSDSSESSSSPSGKRAKILYVETQCFTSPTVLAHMYADLSRDYYVSDDWSIEFYVLQAVRGFIAVGHKTEAGTELILPQIQTSYCVLDWATISSPGKSVQKQMTAGGFTQSINTNPDLVIAKLGEYHGAKSWLCPKYRELCKQLFRKGRIEIAGIAGTRVTFQMCSVELHSGDGELVAGEIGYAIGAVYTSLTGFCKQEKKRSHGTVQIRALARVLETNGFEFLNLGQPPVDGKMQYKADLRGVEISRQAFIDRWNRDITRTLNLDNLMGSHTAPLPLLIVRESAWFCWLAPATDLEITATNNG